MSIIECPKHGLTFHVLEMCVECKVMTATRTKTQEITAKINALREKIQLVTDEAERTKLMRQELELIDKINQLLDKSLKERIS